MMTNESKESKLVYRNEPWYLLLSHEVAQSSQQKVADQLGISRTTVSLVMNGKYPTGVEKVAERVLNQLGGFACMYDGAMIKPEACRATSQAAAPTHNPAKLALWRACQRCPKNKLSGGV